MAPTTHTPSTRRTFIHKLVAALAVGTTATTASAQTSNQALAAAFANLSPAQRKEVQNTLAMGGLYTGTIDGTYGPQTQNGLLRAAQGIVGNGYGDTIGDITSYPGAARLLTGLATGDLAKYAWGEGDEG